MFDEKSCSCIFVLTAGCSECKLFHKIFADVAKNLEFCTAKHNRSIKICQDI